MASKYYSDYYSKKELDILQANFLSLFRPEERLKGLTPEERLKGLSPKERLKGLSLEERLKGLSLEELKQLEQLLKNRLNDQPR